MFNGEDGTHAKDSTISKAGEDTEAHDIKGREVDTVMFLVTELLTAKKTKVF